MTCHPIKFFFRALPHSKLSCNLYFCLWQDADLTLLAKSPRGGFQNQRSSPFSVAAAVNIVSSNTGGKISMVFNSLKISFHPVLLVLFKTLCFILPQFILWPLSELKYFALSHNVHGSKISTLYFLVTYIPPNPASSSFMKDLRNDPLPVQP